MKIKKNENIDRSLSPTTLSYTHIHCPLPPEESGTTFPAVSRGSDLKLGDGSLPRTVGSLLILSGVLSQALPRLKGLSFNYFHVPKVESFQLLHHGDS